MQHRRHYCKHNVKLQHLHTVHSESCEVVSVEPHGRAAAQSHATRVQPEINLTTEIRLALETRLLNAKGTVKRSWKLQWTHLWDGHMASDASAGGGSFPWRGVGEVQEVEVVVVVEEDGPCYYSAGYCMVIT